MLFIHVIQILFMSENVFFHEKKELCSRKKIFSFMKIMRSDVFFVSEILSRNSDIVMLLKVYWMVFINHKE